MNDQLWVLFLWSGFVRCFQTERWPGSMWEVMCDGRLGGGVRKVSGAGDRKQLHSSSRCKASREAFLPHVGSLPTSEQQDKHPSPFSITKIPPQHFQFAFLPNPSTKLFIPNNSLGGKKPLTRVGKNVNSISSFELAPLSSEHSAAPCHNIISSALHSSH